MIVRAILRVIVMYFVLIIGEILSLYFLLLLFVCDPSYSDHPVPFTFALNTLERGTVLQLTGALVLWNMFSGYIIAATIMPIIINFVKKKPIGITMTVFQVILFLNLFHEDAYLTIREAIAVSPSLAMFFVSMELHGRIFRGKRAGLKTNGVDRAPGDK